MLTGRTSGNRLKPSAATTGVVALAAIFGCSGGSNNNDGAREDSAVAVAADAAATTSCLQAREHYARVCGAQSCAISCDVYYSTYEGAACNAELVGYFDCLTALPTVTCTSDFLSSLGGAVCLDKHTAATLCSLTKGADCRAESTFDESCAATNLPAHFYYCKVNVQPPSGCKPYTTNWFCCP